MNRKKEKKEVKNSIDVYSKYSEHDLEYVSEYDERELIQELKFSQQKQFFNDEEGWFK